MTSSLDEAVRLARIVDERPSARRGDAEEDAVTFARALIEAVGEMDRRQAIIDDQRIRLDDRQKRLNERDDARRDVIDQRDTAIARAERAEAALARIAATFSCEPDDSGDLVEAARLLVVERDKAKEALAEQVAANNRQSSRCDAADCLGAMSERARVVEEIAAADESARQNAEVSTRLRAALVEACDLAGECNSLCTGAQWDRNYNRLDRLRRVAEGES